ncbi:uncharacterized protein EI97DRAFT_216390 [Westerdykella ornata]|uniref:Uncharacterized protein n=1 Tax=Westerdykella ornata TaxID=318751 RepID=A0A6A6JQK9_WESOR|nr:uncharacterized protein EI97DRAFT_216390 [Westerdykella ornata]KAF2278667.1 hypothetical protein EI97DRAFT_216390 [Westerdykella ornata]
MDDLPHYGSFKTVQPQGDGSDGRVQSNLAMILRASRPWLLRRERIGIRRFRNSAVLIPNSIQQTRPSDLINLIKPVHREYLDKERTIVFFLTPVFASWLQDHQSFLRPAVERAFEHIFQDTSSSQDTVVSSLAAVVDKLPIPICRLSQRAHDVHQTRKDGLEEGASVAISPWDYVGYDGVAYATVQSGYIQTQARIDGKALGSVGFAAASCTGHLPLANTIFHTGSPTTLVWTEWMKRDDTQDLHLISKKDLTRAVLKTGRTDVDRTQPPVSSVPLIPLTPPRFVEASMGNIVRRIRTEEGKSMTASEELESVVPRYFKARNEAPRPMSVWALVIPEDRIQIIEKHASRWLDRFRGHTPYESVWRSRFPEPYDISIGQDSPLFYGAHLRKVLSGGGGWGKKAGLLSLDPSPAAEDVAPFPGQDNAADIEEVPDLSTALGNVVKPGDSIQFFTTPTAQAFDGCDAEPNLRSAISAFMNMGENPDTWAFGTIPSTVDADEAGSWQHKPAEERTVYEFSNFFGALTEGGMTVSYSDEQAQGTAQVTKIDVPYSRISVSEVHQPIDNESPIRDDVRSPEHR